MSEQEELSQLLAQLVKDRQKIEKYISDTQNFAEDNSARMLVTLGRSVELLAKMTTGLCPPSPTER